MDINDKDFNESIEKLADKKVFEEIVKNTDEVAVGKAYEELTIGEMIDVAGGNSDVDAEASPAILSYLISGAAAGWVASAAAKCKP